MARLITKIKVMISNGLVNKADTGHTRQTSSKIPKDNIISRTMVLMVIMSPQEETGLTRTGSTKNHPEEDNKITTGMIKEDLVKPLKEIIRVSQAPDQVIIKEMVISRTTGKMITRILVLSSIKEDNSRMDLLALDAMQEEIHLLTRTERPSGIPLGYMRTQIRTRGLTTNILHRAPLTKILMPLTIKVLMLQ